jgi:hypothetical protein
VTGRSALHYHLRPEGEAATNTIAVERLELGSGRPSYVKERTLVASDRQRVTHV